MPRKSHRRKRRDRHPLPAPIALPEEKALQEQDWLRYEALCSRIGTSLAGRRKPPDAKIIENLRRKHGF